MPVMKSCVSLCASVFDCDDSEELFLSDDYVVWRLSLRTLEDSDSGGIIVDTASGAKSSDNDGGGGDKIVCEGVV